MSYQPPLIHLEEKYVIRVLICYLLHKIDSPLNENQLVEIITGDEMVNYFDLMTALDGIDKKGLCNISTDNGIHIYEVTETGRQLADEFRKHVPKSIRERVVMLGRDIINKKKREKALQYEIIPTEGGYHVSVVYLNEIGGADLMQIKLYAPDIDSANMMLERILKNPAMFLHYILNYTMEIDSFKEENEWEDI